MQRVHALGSSNDLASSEEKCSWRAARDGTLNFIHSNGPPIWLVATMLIGPYLESRQASYVEEFYAAALIPIFTYATAEVPLLSIIPALF